LTIDEKRADLVSLESELKKLEEQQQIEIDRLAADKKKQEENAKSSKGKKKKLSKGATLEYDPYAEDMDDDLYDDTNFYDDETLDQQTKSALVDTAKMYQKVDQTQAESELVSAVSKDIQQKIHSIKETIIKNGTINEPSKITQSMLNILSCFTQEEIQSHWLKHLCKHHNVVFEEERNQLMQVAKYFETSIPHINSKKIQIYFKSFTEDGSRFQHFFLACYCLGFRETYLQSLRITPQKLRFEKFTQVQQSELFCDYMASVAALFAEVEKGIELSFADSALSCDLIANVIKATHIKTKAH